MAWIAFMYGTKTIRKLLPVGGHDDDAFMLFHLCQKHVDMVAAVLLSVLKNGFTLIKEQQSIVNLCFPADQHPAELLRMWLL